MLPELKHILQQCRMYLITEKRQIHEKQQGSQQIGDAQASLPAEGKWVCVLGFEISLYKMQITDSLCAGAVHHQSYSVFFVPQEAPKRFCGVLATLEPVRY
jgi:hypothetical protein